MLLARRFNTGYMDGHYSVPAGHIDGGETILEGCAREMNEEIGITVKPTDLAVVHVMHRRGTEGGKERIDFFLTARDYTGTIENREPDKCDHLSWFPLNALPDNTVPYIRQAIEAMQRNEFYSEFGWNLHV